ncbi:MAG: hypothetical protein GY723_15110 [bacterium]|nr:hypothetical protein [bacterium]MCP5066661.1 hypothetical protein [bacterium]
MKWKWLLVLPILSFANSARSVWQGEFDAVGFPAPMVPMHAVANGLEALGWLGVLVLASRAPAHAGAIALFLCGAFAFDLVTTWPLEMPVPPGFAIWGSIALALGLAASVALLRASAPRSTR